MPIQVYSFYIFDRHTECVYSKLWVPRPASNLISPPPSRPQSQQPAPGSTLSPGSAPGPAPNPAAAANPPTSSSASNQQQQQLYQQQLKQQLARGRAEKDDAKLIFGTVFSLRNMVRKLGGDDDAFISFRTAHYKLHYYETPTNLRFAMLTEPGALSMRNVLHQIYINLWVEYVVKNPLSPVEHKGGEGVRNEMFEMGLDKFIRGLM
ncbi:snare-like protein [Durotheca rogersii]|uniref:snare-like protein n=1 Tax=Durotheca rogersii TaxID=419775 RepID=UPI00221EEB4D|nr:snare-like protein [Durotheca rogersii]KAI5863261.1 snare-like protein [Durotheca rogersii]